MGLRLYNTLSRQVEDFVPLDESDVRFFVCGPTVYGPMHAGHAKTYTQFDLMATVLRRVHPTLRYVQNLTDVDNKLIDRAEKEGTTVEQVAAVWTAHYHAMMAALGNRQVDAYYRAHDHVGEVIDQVQRLLAAGKAYPIEGAGVYFDLSTFPPHGGLARRTETGEEQSRLEGGVAKRNAGDFVVWKFAKPGEPSWPAPFGEGRPGWHIEDTAITERYLGSSYDIHGGATDLIFPHHEAEIAQMESLTGEPLVRYWAHTGLLEVDGKKMGKSLNNFLTVEALLSEWDWRTLRYALLASHYRSTMTLSSSVLEAAQAARDRVETYYRERAPQGPAGPVAEAVWAWLLNDLDTPRALAAVFTAVRSETATRGDLEAVNEWLGSVWDWAVPQAPERVLALVEEREQARRDKAWARADELRNELSALGWAVKDTPEGPVLAYQKT